MTPTLHSLPNMRLEAIGLLYVAQNVSRLTAAFAGILFSQKNPADMAHLAVYKRYVAAFRKNARIDPAWRFFAKMPLHEYLVCALAMLLEDAPFYDSVHSDAEIYSLLQRAYRYVDESGAALDKLKGVSSLEDYIKSNSASADFAALCAAPGQHFIDYSQIVRNNIPAAELAWDTVRADVRPFLEQYWKPAYFLQNSLFAQNTQLREIYPVLVTFTTAWIIDGTGYCGVYNISTEPNSDCAADTAILLDFAKAAGDARRLEILLLICEKPRYNRELAELLHLSPATVMHHTDALIQSGFIALAPSQSGQKRVYFQVCAEKLAVVQRAYRNLFGKYI